MSTTLKSADVLHGKIPACMVVGSAHHVYLRKQPFQPLLHLLLWHLLRRRLWRHHPLHLLRRRPLAPRLLLLPHEWLRCGKRPHL